jgi:hypothetical protein
MHEHEEVTLTTVNQRRADIPRQTVVGVTVKHDHGAVADSEKHEHALSVGLEVEGQTIQLWQDRDKG